MPSTSALRGRCQAGESRAVVNVAGAANVTLSVAQTEATYIELQGALTGNITITLPVSIEDSGFSWSFFNNTTGAFSITLAAAPGGATVLLAQGVRSTYVYSGAAMLPGLNLDAGQVGTGTIAAARLGTGTPDATTFLRGDQSWASLNRGAQILLCAGFTPVATGADAAEVPIPFDPADGTSVLTWNIRRIWLRVGTAGGAPVAVIQKSTVGNAAFGAGTTVGTLTMPSGDSEVAVSSSLGTIQSGNKLRFSVTTLGTALNWSIGCEIGL